MSSKSDSFKPEPRILRRQPRQVRSEKTVARIMEITLDLILKEGYNALTTNRIAQEAKVNISSLYQYFPNKYSIVLAMYEKAAAELATISRDSMLRELHVPLEIGIPRNVDRMMKFLETRQGVFVHLLNEVPELRQTAAQTSVENLTAQTTYVFIKHHLPDLPEAVLRFKMFFCQHTSMALAYRYLQERPKGISRKRFIAETSRIMIDILMSSSPLPKNAL